MITNKQELHAILGISGGIGQAIARKLTQLGKPIMGINRTGKLPKAIQSDIKIIGCDIYNVDKAVEILKDATHIYNCLNVPYQDWVREFPKIASAYIEIIRKVGARGIITDNLYMYGEHVTGQIKENLPYAPHGKKGRVRAKIARMYEEEMTSGTPLVICRAPDFFGPGVTEGSFYGSRVFENAILGKKVSLIGNLNKPHQMIFIDDFATAIVNLALTSTSYGQVWHAPSDKAITQGEFVSLIFEELGLKPRIGTSPDLVIKVLGLFIPIMKEIKEMLYEFNNDYLVDSSKYVNNYGLDVTDHRIAIRATLKWFQQNV